MYPHLFSPKFLHLLVASSLSERRIAALPSMGLSAGERTARMS